jgi:hypothetical protein
LLFLLELLVTMTAWKSDALMPEGVAIGVLLCALVIAVVVRVLIGAVFLRASVALYNKMADGPSSPSNVPAPALGKAMWIIFATCLAQMAAGLVIAIVSGAGPAAPGAREQGAALVADLITIPVSLLIMAWVLSERLPTTFGRAVSVTFWYMLMELLVVGVLVGIVVLAFALALTAA